MTTTVNLEVGAPLARTYTWQTINWKAVKNLVYKLQMRIAKAINCQDWP